MAVVSILLIEGPQHSDADDVFMSIDLTRTNDDDTMEQWIEWRLSNGVWHRRVGEEPYG